MTSGDNYNLRHNVSHTVLNKGRNSKLEKSPLQTCPENIFLRRKIKQPVLVLDLSELDELD